MFKDKENVQILKLRFLDFFFTKSLQFIAQNDYDIQNFMADVMNIYFLPSNHLNLDNGIYVETF